MIFLFQRARLLSLFIALVVLSVSAACSGEEPDIDATIDARVQLALDTQPTVTPQPTQTPVPTSTPQLLPTPLPTATPAPTATPQPTSTPAAVPTPAPTATPQPTSTPNLSIEPTPTAIAVPNDLYGDVRLSVVKIINGNSSGSGWAIEDGWIITNEHVVTGSSTVTIEVPNKDGGVDVKTGTVRGFDTKRDLAAVEVDHGAPVLATRIVTADDAGTPIMQLGYSVSATGGFPAVHTGVVTAVIRHLGSVLDGSAQRADLGGDSSGVGVVVMDADADPGDSGGPVVDLQGNAVGITFGAAIRTPSGKRILGQQQATSIESINRVWQQLKNGVITSSI